ncbi:deoxynucleotide monophosphate kinase [Rhizobium sp. 16-449-1b]|uniref:deoxynucleotide monophosphate kinase family protein n=1 Tax=Rhizobium sp. 16-449-1b TaxID=2819989 RepID=UPI001ADAC990|nr:deoxynucleotide monophosphate kinase [Rhizobium sp. 16-449-1b]MBO9194298.1 deoxynucleotide monophosphate kinase [Rhizobium sp. 16-449-1b]
MTPTDNWTPWTADGDLWRVPNTRDVSQIAALGAAIGKPIAANDNLPPVVAFTGAAGSGKSTAASYLVEKLGYTRVRFAGPLKAAMAAMGFSHAEIEGELKETPNDLLGGRTPRHAMQTLGTEWGRNCIVDDFWIRLWRREVDAVLAAEGRVVVDDCRFPNEAQAIRKLGGDIFKIVGRGGIAGGHVSERGCGDQDLEIANDNSPERLFGKVEEALLRYG